MLRRLRRWLGILTDQELTALDHRDELARQATWPILDRAFPTHEDDAPTEEAAGQKVDGFSWSRPRNAPHGTPIVSTPTSGSHDRQPARDS